MKRFPVLGCVALALTVVSFGQEPVDPPSRVARLNFLAGNVAFRPANVEDWAPATMNYPLTSGDHLWTDEQGGAELHIGSAALRIAGSTSFAVLNLDDRITQVSIAQGFMNVRLRHLEEGETFEVDTPNGAIALIRPGDYRVGVDPESNATMVFVRAGGAEVTGGNRTFPVDNDQQVRFIGTDQVDAESLEPPSPDQWDDWCAARNREDDRAVQEVAPYVGNEMIGAEDLANNGEWRSDPEYGRYWVPRRVAVDWAPYRYGHWAYVMPWGWTWIDDAPWGFAPFHYGRWAMIGGGWGWVPGAVVRRPVYAPALVAFVGGNNFSVAIGIGGGGGVAAWVPLGPREVYRPYYRTSNTYIRQVNVTNVNVTNINVTNVNYVNRTYVTAVRQETFVGARPVSSGYVRVPANAMARAERVDVVNVRPAREAYLGRPVGGMRVAAPPANIVDRTVMVRTAPSAAVQTRAPIRMVQTNTVREVPRGLPAGGQQGNPRGQYNGGPINTPSGNNSGRPQFNQPQYTQPSRNTGNQNSINQPGGQQPYYRPGNTGNQTGGNQPSNTGNRPKYNPQVNTGNQTGGNQPGNTVSRPNYNPQVNTGNQTGNQPSNTGNRPNYNPQVNTGNQTGGNQPSNTGNRPNYNPQVNTGNQTGGNQPSNTGNRPNYNPQVNTGNQTGGNQPSNTGNRPNYNPQVNTGNQTGGNQPSNTGNRPNYSPRVNTGNQTGNQTGGNPSGNSTGRPAYNTPSNSGNQTGGNQSGNTGSRPAYTAPNRTVEQHHDQPQVQQKKTTDDKKK
jgi:hypothetical protein